MPDSSSTPFGDCALVFDLTDRKFLFISPHIDRVLGHTAAALYKDPGELFEMITPDFRGGVKSRIEQLAEGDWIDVYQIHAAAKDATKQQAKKTWIHARQNVSTDVQNGHKILLSIVTTYNPDNLTKKEEARLREQFLNSLIDSQTNFMIRFDTNGNFTFANKQFLKFVGYKKSELFGKHFTLVTIPEEYSLCEKMFINCVAHPGKVFSLAHKKLDKAGNVHDTEWEFISVTNEEGTVIAVQGIGHDVTEKLVIEREVKSTAEKLDSFIESITDSFFIIDNEWKFVRVNGAFEKVSHMDRKALIGNVIWDVFPIILDTGFERAYRKAANEKANLQLTEYFASVNRWFNLSVYPSAEGLTVFVRDISDERHAQEEVVWTKTSLEALINNTEDQIWSIDTETRYVYMNKAYRKQIVELTGCEPQQGNYSYLHEGYTNEMIAEWNRYYARALTGERYTIVTQGTDLLTQKLLSFEISFNPIYKIKGDITGVGCFARNITQWLETEKAIVDQNERLRNIASLTSHELRRPVASLLGLLNIMDRNNFFNPDNKEIIEHLLTVGNEIDDVIRLIVDKTYTDGVSKNKYQSP